MEIDHGLFARELRLPARWFLRRSRPSSATVCFGSDCRYVPSMNEEPLIVKEGTGTPAAGGGLPSLAGSVEKDGQHVIPDVLPILPTREMVVFPGTVVPLTIRRESSLPTAGCFVAGRARSSGLVAQRDATKDDPTPEDLFGVGTAITVLEAVAPA